MMAHHWMYDQSMVSQPVAGCGLSVAHSVDSVDTVQLQTRPRCPPRPFAAHSAHCWDHARRRCPLCQDPTRRCSRLPGSPGVARGRPSCHVPGDGWGNAGCGEQMAAPIPESRAQGSREIRDFSIIPQPKFSHLSHIGSMPLHGSAVGWPSLPI